MATASPRFLTAKEFLAIRWDDPDAKAELDNGVIRMMAGGDLDHSRVQGNVFGLLFNALDGTSCRPHGSDMGVTVHDLSFRYPDVSVVCGEDAPELGGEQRERSPRLVVEVLSRTTRDIDLGVKLVEYRAVGSIDHILLIDPKAETSRLLTRTGPRAWNDAELRPEEDVNLSALGVTLRQHDIFRRR